MYSKVIKCTDLGSEIGINVKAVLTDSASLIKYQDKEKYNGFCKDGCENCGKNWSCPPHSPSYHEYAGSYKNALIVLYYSRLDQFGLIKPREEIVTYSHEFLKSQIDKLMYSLEETFDGVSILNGHCQMCANCACKSGHACLKPDKMRYSMESLGLDVVGISSGIFQHEIQWYLGNDLPEHSTILSCLLTNTKIEENHLHIHIL